MTGIASRLSPSQGGGALEQSFPAINPSFLADRGVVLLEMVDDALVVGMVDLDDAETIAALRFASGREIKPVSMLREEISGRVGVTEDCGDGCRETVLLQQAPAAINGASLLDRVSGQVVASPLRITALDPLRRILQSGCGPAEAGMILIEAQQAGEKLHPQLVSLAEHLRNGGTLQAAVGMVSALPRWLAGALACCLKEEDQAEMLVRLLVCERMAEDRSSAVRMLNWEIVAWAIAAVSAWHAVAFSAGAVIALLFFVLWFHVRALTSTQPSRAFVQSQVLGIAGILARMRVPTSMAIRTALARLSAIVPTWGTLPDGRVDLARALSLPPIDAALLSRGEFADVVEQAADSCGARGDRTLDRCRSVVRCAGLSSLALAIALMLR